MDGCKIFEVCIDGISAKKFSWETVNTYFIKNGYTHIENPCGISEYWAEFWTMLEKYPMERRTEYTDNEFCEALEIYRNQKIQDSIHSENPIVRMFAVLDRRLGKRTLSKMQQSISEQPEWLRQFYELRFSKKST